MTKLPALKPKEIIRVLEQVGFSFVRQKGSHRIYTKENIAIIVPYHNKDLKRGTLRKIVKQIGLTIDEFVKLS